jgi:hypothetical protein
MNNKSFVNIINHDKTHIVMNLCEYTLSDLEKPFTQWVCGLHFFFISY